MKIAIVEDEPLVQQRIERFVREHLAQESCRITSFNSLAEAEDFLAQQEIDLLFLDLNLHGQNGFDLLKNQLAQGFHTVIVSAYAEKAIEAYEYGVLDFIAKPFTKERLGKALDKIQNSQLRNHYGCRFLSIKKLGTIELVPVADIQYIKADGHYSQLHLKQEGGTKQKGLAEQKGVAEQKSASLLHNKSIENVFSLLPEQFERIHRSYIVNMNEVARITIESGSRYHVQLKDDALLPVSRNKFELIRSRLSEV